MSKTISFKTFSGRKFADIPFNEVDFFQYFRNCGVADLIPQHQIILLLNNLFESELELHPYDSVCEIDYTHIQSQEFIERYELVNNMLKFNI